MSAAKGNSLVLNIPGFFKDPEFVAWLNNSSAKFTIHQGGEPHEFSDVIVGVEPCLNGEGTDSDMPEHVWNFIMAQCRKNFVPTSGVPHILVWLTNLN